MNREWNIGDEVRPQDYTEAAIYCNEKGDRHIEKQDGKYIVVANVVPEPTIEDQIKALEQQVTARNIRAGLLGDEYALNKMRDIEAQIEELRRQLESQEVAQ